MSFIVAESTSDDLLSQISIGCATFVTLLGLFTFHAPWDYLEKLLEDFKNYSNEFFKKITIALFKKEIFIDAVLEDKGKKVFIDAALEDKGIAKNIEEILLEKCIGSALINNVVEDFETNNDLQKAKVIIILYCDNPSTNWIRKHLEIYLKHLVLAKLNQSLKILVGTTQEKKVEVEKYINNNNVKKLNIGVIKLGEKQDYEKLLSVIRKKLRE